MKIAFQEKNIIESEGLEWEYCDGCIFNMEEKISKEEEIPSTYPCDLFQPKCKGYDIYQQLTTLDEIFKV